MTSAVKVFLEDDFVAAYETPDGGVSVTALFRDELGRLDRSAYWEYEIVQFAQTRVESKDLGELDDFIGILSDEPLLTARFFRELSTQDLVQAPYGNDELRDLYWLAVSSLMAQLFRIVEKLSAELS